MLLMILYQVGSLDMMPKESGVADAGGGAGFHRDASHMEMAKYVVEL
jgi:hypothetical protein